MPGFLTDAHMSPKVAVQVQAKRRDCQIHCLRSWRGGRLLDAEDNEILIAAFEEGLTLITYDQRTIVPLVSQWMMEGRSHGGVVFIDEQSILQEDIGGQVLALVELWDSANTDAWTVRIICLRRARARGDSGHNAS